jgi:signal transduction histidine kinase
VTVRVSEESDNGSARMLLEVSDTGHGIAPELHHSIFEMYFSTKAERGTGIGLASVRALMDGVGGTVSVDSAPACGATFRLSFPVQLGSPTQRASS